METKATNEYSASAIVPPATETATNESPQELWLPIQMNETTLLLDKLIATIEKIFQENRQLLTWLGLATLAIIALRILFAGLQAIDSIPLVTPILKLVGSIYVGRFVWRYLIREQDRQELIETIDRTKAEVLGSQN
ncbi:CAAD domain-containing protein [Chamaesiphon sp. VAR_69_metabat_338]|uniref:CAAD domain-containing protein n=1 Tax=Chamaesiphon sp. VAR_69_metabat_338 TaxID=2964704 RepID=UPI00286E3DA1|nr:CAAD domain-containing protein [Chamaesiphon sp. VAR_69_metabat_338]